LTATVEKHKIDGIVAYNDIIATRTMNILINCGKKIPEEIGIMGFDNSQFAEIALVPLTSVKFPKKRLAQLAIEMIFHFIRGDLAETTHTIPITLEIRESTSIHLHKV
jgi:DNA-binding LacI/PurR family transcriptional regulator